jgi:hypothetical protein
MRFEHYGEDGHQHAFVRFVQNAANNRKPKFYHCSLAGCTASFKVAVSANKHIRTHQEALPLFPDGSKRGWTSNWYSRAKNKTPAPKKTGSKRTRRKYECDSEDSDEATDAEFTTATTANRHKKRRGPDSSSARQVLSMAAAIEVQMLEEQVMHLLSFALSNQFNMSYRTKLTS